MKRALILAGLLLASTARAGSEDARALLKRCKDALNDDTSAYVDSGYCLGYVMGVWDATGPVDDVNCYPNNASLEQMVRIVVRYLEAHPEILNERPFYHVVNAMDETFPCPKKPKPRPTPRGF